MLEPYVSLPSALFIASLIFLGSTFYQRLKCGKVQRLPHVLIRIMLCICCGLIIQAFFVPSSLTPAKYEMPDMLQVIPFNTIREANLMNLLGNVVPFAIFSILLYLQLASIKLSAAIGIETAAIVEPAQLMINTLTGYPNFVVDIDDFLLQMLGAVIGVLVAVIARQALHNRN